MKGLKDGSVKTYLFQAYPNNLEEVISLAMQEKFSRRQAKLHANAPKQARSAVRTGGREVQIQ
ncbi:hypothetical protein V7S43_012886 [Phytophthora oleae]|uniref:Uncharacterized protein n=1 Tax=Phytophthora oleae TaxID=2107226 RepID=A0ABD3F8S5_9STRA